MPPRCQKEEAETLARALTPARKQLAKAAMGLESCTSCCCLWAFLWEPVSGGHAGLGWRFCH